MSRGPQLALWPLVLGLLGFLPVVLAPAIVSAQECVGLPTAAIEVSRPATDQVAVEAVSPSEIERLAGASAMQQSPHRLMVILETIDAHFTLSRPFVQRSPTQFCAAAKAVTISFGVFRRRVVITNEAAADACVKDALLRHEAEHYRILDEAIDAFLRQRRDQIRQAFTGASMRPAPSREAAIKALEANLMDFLNRMVKQFEEQELSGIRRAADNAADLASLRSACGGRVRELEERLSQPGKTI